MSGRLRLTLSCGDYETTRALQDGTVRPDGIELIVLTDDLHRIYRLERRDECDLAEFNVIAYFMARDAGHPLTALPIFPHRRFRHGFVFVNRDRGIHAPRDLIGRKVGIQGYQPAAIIWIRGILQEFFDVPFDAVDWIDPFGILGTPPPGAEDVDYGAARAFMENLFEHGGVDALLSPNVPRSVAAGEGRFVRLFPDYRELEIDYYRQTRIFPIMHALTLRQELVDRHPWVPASIASAFEQAKRRAYQRVRNPRVVPLAFFQHAWEEQASLLGPDPWQYGLGDANRRNLETALRYAHEQGLIGRRAPVDELFLDLEVGALAPVRH